MNIATEGHRFSFNYGMAKTKLKLPRIWLILYKESSICPPCTLLQINHLEESTVVG